MIEKDLQKIGLTEKEARVYLACLELGQSTVQQIANKSKVNRATTYVILDALQEKKVISTVEEGTKRLFVANGPYALRNVIRRQQEVIERKKKRLKSIFTNLKKVHNTLPNRARVRFYEGKEGLQSIREQFLEIKGKDLYAFYSQDEVRNVFTKEDREAYTKRRRELKNFYHTIYNPSDKVPALAGSDEFTNRYAVPKDKFPFPCDITIYDDYLSIAILSGYPSGIVIESESIANTFRSIFKLAEKAAKKYQKEAEEKAKQQ